VVSLKSAYAQRVAFGMMAPEKDKQRWHVQLRCESILGNRVMLACSNRAILAAPAVPRGSRNKINRDLMENDFERCHVDWITIKTADDLARIASGGDACEKFLSWLRVHHPKGNGRAFGSHSALPRAYAPSKAVRRRGTLHPVRKRWLRNDRHNKMTQSGLHLGAMVVI